MKIFCNLSYAFQGHKELLFVATIPAFSWNQISSSSAFINKEGHGVQELELREKNKTNHQTQ